MSMIYDDYSQFEAQYCYKPWMPGVSEIATGAAWGTINTMVGNRCIQEDPIVHYWGLHFYAFNMRLDPDIVVYRAIQADIPDWLLVRRIGPPKVFTVVVEPVDDMGVVIIKCYNLAGDIEFQDAFDHWDQVFAWHLSIFILQNNVQNGSMTNQQKVNIIFQDGTCAEYNTMVKPKLRRNGNLCDAFGQRQLHLASRA